ncbi:MAG TPA: hypothetical protein VFI73_00605 [Candidatus Nitrosopolaris sp.]|nr:hypothetical protein [Candidatus Nitrosopolaris sp.]
MNSGSNVNDNKIPNDIPENATIREEYVKCSNSACQKCKIDGHGPYLYAYWKRDKKLKKRYVGKSWEDYRNSKIANEIDLTSAQYRKFKFLRAEACKGNPLAVQYLVKLKNQEVSIDWAYRVIINSNHEQTTLKMMAIADQKHQNYENEIELIEIIASEMKKQGLDLTENLESYLNSKIM